MSPESVAPCLELTAERRALTLAENAAETGHADYAGAELADRRHCDKLQVWGSAQWPALVGQPCIACPQSLGGLALGHSVPCECKPCRVQWVACVRQAAATDMQRRGACLYTLQAELMLAHAACACLAQPRC